MTQIDKRPTPAGAAIAKELAEQGFRIFTIADAYNVALGLGYKEAYIRETISHLRKVGWVEKLRRNLYILSPIFLGGTPIHEFEIATYIAKEAVISHFSAFHHHGLTDQIPQTIYATVVTGSNLPRPKKGEDLIIWGASYNYIQIKKPQFFGHMKIWIGDVKVSITDLERTLLDGLVKPGCCGGIQEVLSAFKGNIDNVDVQTMVKYALKLDASVAKRLGWVLEKLMVTEDKLTPLLLKEFQGYAPLDASGARSGSYCKRWQVQENL